MPPVEQLRVARVDDDVEIVDTDGGVDAFAAYFADGADASEKEIVYDETLGLACEKLPEGYTMTSLWNVAQE